LVIDFFRIEHTQMQNDIEQIDKGRKNGKIIIGFILLIFGAVLLLQQIGDIFLPSWLFSWPMWVLVIGIYSGVKQNFSKPTAYIMIAIGTIGLLNKIFPGYNLSDMIWPIIIISIGITMILNRNQKWDRSKFKRRKPWDNKDWSQSQQYSWDKKVTPESPAEPIVEGETNTAYSDNTGYASTGGYQKTYKGHPIEDYLDSTSIFGSANKTIFTKNFRGGEIVNIFGGAEIDFTQSDINGQVVIDVTQIFGGIKLLVPPHWHVTSDTVSLFAGFDDKRKQKNNLTSDKVLMITGTSIFAGIEIRSY
jgi:predicted membrane protein